VRLQSPDRLSRTDKARAQYANALAPAEYLRAICGSHPEGRLLRSRLHLVQDTLATWPGGNLLDVGCGPGIMARTLLTSRPDDFRITALDLSAAMVRQCVTNVQNTGQRVFPAVGQAEALPFADASFDVALATGVLEYADLRPAVAEISRVVRPGGLVIVSMLNPLSPYRITEWFAYWPLLRGISLLERLLRVPTERQHGVCRSGIRAVGAARFRRLLAQAGLEPLDVVHYDISLLLPPADRLRTLARFAARTPSERTARRGWNRWLATAYVIVARRR
jgi:SAM-dependent methyltransferase